MLQWTREQDCPWSARTAVYAVHYGHDALLRWALQNGCAEASSADYASDLGTDDLEDSDDGNSDGDGHHP